MLAAIKKYLRDNRASLGSIVTMALGFAVLVTVVMVTNFIGVSIFNAIQPQIGTISDTNVSKAVNSTTWGTFKGLEIFGSMIQVVVVVMVAGIVLALIIRSFGGGGRGGGGAI